VVGVTDPYGRNLGFLDWSHYFQQLLSCAQEAEWILFQTHYFSENLVVLGPLDLQPGTLTTRPQQQLNKNY
jgi:hypothetical protein